jgi:hypothetical protein
VPSIRVAGKWLAEMGFACGDRVRLTAENGKITLRSKRTGAGYSKPGGTGAGVAEEGKGANQAGERLMP